MKAVAQPLTEEGEKGGWQFRHIPGFEQKLIKPDFFTKSSLAVLNVRKKVFLLQYVVKTVLYGPKKATCKNEVFLDFCFFVL
jgi:hypothetical protein